MKLIHLLICVSIIYTNHRTLLSHEITLINATGENMSASVYTETTCRTLHLMASESRTVNTSEREITVVARADSHALCFSKTIKLTQATLQLIFVQSQTAQGLKTIDLQSASNQIPKTTNISVQKE